MSAPVISNLLPVDGLETLESSVVLSGLVMIALAPVGAQRGTVTQDRPAPRGPVYDSPVIATTTLTADAESDAVLPGVTMKRLANGQNSFPGKLR